MSRSRLKARAHRVVRGVRGATGTEYALLVLLIGVTSALAIIAAGKLQLGDYEEARDLVLVPAT